MKGITMKKILFITFLTLYSVIFTGCASQKVDENKNYLLTFCNCHNTYDEERKNLKNYFVDENGNKNDELTNKLNDFIKKNNVTEIGDRYYISERKILIAHLTFEDSCEGYYSIDLNKGIFKKVPGYCQYFSNIDYYKDSIIFTTSDCIEESFTLDENLKFSRKTSKYQKIIDSGISDLVVVPECRYHSYKEFSLARAFDEIGYVICKDDDAFWMIKANGKREKIDNIDICMDIIYYDKEKIWFVIYDIDDSCLWSLNLKTGKTEKEIDFRVNSQVNICDNKLYYTNDMHLYEYDLIKKEEKLIYSYEEKPALFYEPYYQEGEEETEELYYYNITNGKCFVCDLDGEELKWFRIDGCGEDAILTDINCPIKKISNRKYGTIERKTELHKCPFCGNVINENSFDLFQLNDKYSEFASKINETLVEKQNIALSYCEEVDDDSECNRHTDDMFIGRTDTMFEKANVYEDRFLVIEMAESYYSGGAHGSNMELQYVFDLETGEELNAKNFFDGTEEEFKDLIAKRAAVEMVFTKYSNYDYDDQDDAYEAAYNAVTTDENNLFFYDDNVVYCFQTYELGCYADGELHISLSYDELNGHSTMTRVR